ncbi:MAG: hypothetical protein AAGA03_12760, partial [Planctomycetota bacterium]
RVDVAAALNRKRHAQSPIARVASVLATSRLNQHGHWDRWRDAVSADEPSRQAHGPLHTTPPLRRRRQVACQRVMAIGDAAAYIEPFTGEGMTWAMQSGISMADLIARAPATGNELANEWQRKWKSLSRLPKWQCRLMVRLLESPTASRYLGTVLSRFPHLAVPSLRILGRGVAFPAIDALPPPSQ